MHQWIPENIMYAVLLVKCFHSSDNLLYTNKFDGSYYYNFIVMQEISDTNFNISPTSSNQQYSILLNKDLNEFFYQKRVIN